MEFSNILMEHKKRYPMMTSQDYVKLCYQSEYGPRHMLENCDSALAYIDREWSSIDSDTPNRKPEYIGNDLCRFYMNKSEYSKEASQLLGELFYLTAKDHFGTYEGLYKRLECLDPENAEYIADYKSKGSPAVHHSRIYNENYKPHYRLIKWEYACYFKALLEIKKLDKPAVIAIDGRCGSGKTSFASIIKTLFDCNVFHIDDYYIPQEKRPVGWEKIPGGNIDFMRFKNEVVLPSKAGGTVQYRPYNCGTGEYMEAVSIEHKDLTIIEGSCSHHPLLSREYDLKLFLTCDKDTQKKRLMEREGDYYKMFEKRWIPMEEFYFFTFDVPTYSDLVIDTSYIF